VPEIIPVVVEKDIPPGKVEDTTDKLAAGDDEAVRV
jgi:hypothetical protein